VNQHPRRAPRWLLAPGAALVFAIAAPRSARADEPLIPGELRMMREPGEPVDVPDAADDLDPIDIEATLAFHLDIGRGVVTRHPAGQDATPVASWSTMTSRLVPEIRVGLFHDLAATTRLPIILSRTASLAPIDGSPANVTDAGGEPLFQTPVRSPERSGVEYISFGLLAGVMNQTRSPSLPSWTLGAEVQVPIGPAQSACNEAAPSPQVRCAAPGDLNRDGVVDANEPDGEVERDPGIGRGTVGIALHTAISRRVRYFEPFGQLDVTFEVPVGQSPLRAPTPSASSMLPVRGEGAVGLGIVPWENRERFSRVWVDARVAFGFATRGRDFSPLFDALGSSAAPSLRASRTVDGERLYETGVSTVGPHGSLGAATSFVWRASQLIRLGVDLSVVHDFEHAIVDDEPDEPLYRSQLDEESGRFSIASTVRVKIGAVGTVLF